MTQPRPAIVRLTSTPPRWSMATSPHLSDKLREALGNDVGEELIGIVDRTAGDISELRGDVAELRHEMQVGFARIGQLMTTMK